MKSVPLGCSGVAWWIISAGKRETQHLVTWGEPRDSGLLPLLVEAQLSPGLSLSGGRVSVFSGSYQLQSASAQLETKISLHWQNNLFERSPLV